MRRLAGPILPLQQDRNLRTASRLPTINSLLRETRHAGSEQLSDVNAQLCQRRTMRVTGVQGRRPYREAVSRPSSPAATGSSDGVAVCYLASSRDQQLWRTTELAPIFPWPAYRRLYLASDLVLSGSVFLIQRGCANTKLATPHWQSTEAELSCAGPEWLGWLSRSLPHPHPHPPSLTH